MTKAGLLFTPLMLVTAIAQAQTGTSPSRPEFEVASIKPNKSAFPGGFIRFLPGGRLIVTNRPLKALMLRAYESRQPVRISGGPGWFDVDQYDIVAKGGVNATEVQMRLMLQALLADRFGLKFHRETRDMPVYALVERKAGAPGAKGLSPAQDPDCNPIAADDPQEPPFPGPKWTTPCGMALIQISSGGAVLHGRSVSLSTFASTLSSAVDPQSYFPEPTSDCRPVIDKTGIQGVFDIDLQWSSERARFAQPDGGSASYSIFAALQEQLGLKLEPQRGPVDVLVVDEAVRPSDN